MVALEFSDRATGGCGEEAAWHMSGISRAGEPVAEYRRRPPVSSSPPSVRRSGRRPVRCGVSVDAEEDVPLLARVIGAIPGRVLDHADADVAILSGASVRHIGVAGMLFGGELLPVGGVERDVVEAHALLREIRPPYLLDSAAPTAR